MKHCAFDVLLLGYFGFGNLGDELLAQAAVRYLTACGLSRDRIAVLANAPLETGRSLGIKAFDRWRLASLCEALGASRSLLLAGGGLFQDASSLRSPFYYWGVVRLARLKSRPVWALGQSVGPLSSAVSRRLTKDALSRCAYFAVRDEPSREAARSLGLAPLAMPDPVLGTPLPHVNVCNAGPVLVNVRPAGDARPQRAVLSAARACAASGRALSGVALADEDEATMLHFIELGEMPACKIVRVRSAEDFAQAADGASGAIGMRLHFGILSMLAGLGVALAPYDPKVSGFLSEWGLAALCQDEKYRDADIMNLLTDTPFQDKRKQERVHSLLTTCFSDGLRRVLEDG